MLSVWKRGSRVPDYATISDMSNGLRFTGGGAKSEPTSGLGTNLPKRQNPWAGRIPRRSVQAVVSPHSRLDEANQVLRVSFLQNQHGSTDDYAK